MATLTLRPPEDLHQVARIAAAAAGQSVSAWILGAMRAQALRAAEQDKRGPVAAELERQTTAGKGGQRRK
jgi:uncharacterized protein (DUF1778 family)